MLADLHSQFNDVQKHLQGKDIRIVWTWIILTGFQGKIGLFKSSIALWDFRYFFSNLQQLEDENISDCDLEIYLKYLEKFRENFKVCFEDLEKMHVTD